MLINYQGTPITASGDAKSSCFNTACRTESCRTEKGSLSITLVGLFWVSFLFYPQTIQEESSEHKEANDEGVV